MDHQHHLIIKNSLETTECNIWIVDLSMLTWKNGGAYTYIVATYIVCLYNGFLRITWATFEICRSSSALKPDKILILYLSRVMSLENSNKVQNYFISGW